MMKKLKKLLNSKRETNEHLNFEKEEIERYSDFLKDLVDNLEQKRAVVSDSNRILVLAGAGSGKTKVLTKRFVHLVKNKKVKEEDILAVTFTRNAKDEMIERVSSSLDIKKENLRNKIKTFHGLCWAILGQNEQFKLVTESEQKKIIEEIISGFRGDEEIMDNLYDYIKDNILDKMREKDLQDTKQVIFKDKPNNNIIKEVFTQTRIPVKSKSERDLADFLTALGLKWEYETEVGWADKPFKPDFIIEGDIYLEHWCYNDQSTEIRGIDKKAYLKHRRWKENQFKKYKKILISVEESEMVDLLKLQIKLRDKLETLLKRELEKKEILELLQLSPIYKRAYDKFIDEVIEIINLAKSELIEVDEIKERIKKQKKEKIKNFYAVLIPVMEKYEHRLKTTEFGMKDFNDLIKDTVNLLKSDKSRREYYQRRIKYLLVDEFQDVSFGEVELIKLLITPETNFFAVGDDWQSIYGWRGASVRHILKFEEEFGKHEKIILPINYRSTKNIVEASSHFIQLSQNQYKKDIRCCKENEKENDKILQVNAENDFGGTNFILWRIKKMLSENPLNKPNNFLILYRSSRSMGMGYQKLKDQCKNLGIKIETIHYSKGTEADYVFVIGLKSGLYGFPCIYADKDIKRIILDIPIEEKEEEERRLFYVAMTRAKKELILVSEQGNESEFVKDIPEEYKIIHCKREQ
jgi:DNA helicase-4